MLLRYNQRTVNYTSKPIITRLYKALVRSQLEYCAQTWRPYVKRDIQKLDKVYRRATKLIYGCSNLSYEDRLKSTGLVSLQDRWTRGDLTEVFKILRGSKE